MLLKENFYEEHIRDLQRNSKRDPVLLERTVYAFGLFEALARVGMPFVFKGETWVMFHLITQVVKYYLISNQIETTKDLLLLQKSSFRSQGGNIFRSHVNWCHDRSFFL